MVNSCFLAKYQTEEYLVFMKAAQNNRIKPAIPGTNVEIINLETKVTTIYEFIWKAALANGSDIKSILPGEKNQMEKGINTPYISRYMITIKRF